MSRDGKNSIGQPRLSVVESGQPAVTVDGDANEFERSAADGATTLPDIASPSTVSSASPVHDLIHSIEGAIEPAAPISGEPEPNPSLPSHSEPSAAASLQEAERIRVLEAVIFASNEPVDEARLTTYLKPGEDLHRLLAGLQQLYSGRGVTLVKVAGKWCFRTAEDLSWALERHSRQERRLSKAGLETLAIVAYHQPVTRAEIEEVRGVSISKGTLDVLMEIGWVRPRGRRRAPGKPITYGTTDRFLAHFGLDQIRDLPGIADLKAQGLLDANLPPDFKVPEPTDIAALMPDELPLEAGGDGDEPLQTELELEPLEDDEDTADGPKGEAP